MDAELLVALICDNFSLGVDVRRQKQFGASTGSREILGRTRE